MFIFSLLFLACDSSEVVTINRCQVQIINATPQVAQIGEPLYISAYPMTETWDTIVDFNGSTSEIININKDNCTDCDECRIINSCTSCDYCELCIDSCIECAQSIEVVVPELFSTTTAEISITNAHGTSDYYSVSIESANSDDLDTAED
jgi:hypothetical protein